MSKIQLLTDLHHNGRHFTAGETLDSAAHDITPEQIADLQHWRAVEELLDDPDDPIPPIEPVEPVDPIAPVAPVEPPVTSKRKKAEGAA